MCNPREDDNLSIMVCYHRRYDLGDVLPTTPYVCESEATDWDDMREKYVARGALFIKPLYLYDHGMQSISTRSFIGRAPPAHWDSGQVGFVFTTQKQIDLIGTPARLIEAELDVEVEIYDRYLQGEDDLVSQTY